jgi:hypothetical protein
MTFASGRVTTLLVAVTTLAHWSCESPPDLRSLRAYSRDGVSFNMPGNWSVTEDKAEEGSGFRYLFIEAPGNPIMIIWHFEPPSEVTLEEFSESYLESVLEETSSMTMGEAIEGTEYIGLGNVTPFSSEEGASSTRTVQNISGTERDGVEFSYSISAFDETVPHRVWMFRVSSPKAVTFLAAQAAVEDWDLALPGFRVVFRSLKIE